MLVNVQRLRAAMAERALAAVVATTPENVFYLTGIRSVGARIQPHVAQCYAVVTRDRVDEPAFVCFRGEVDQVLDCLPDVRPRPATYGTFFREVPAGAELEGDEERLRRVSVDAPSATTPLEALTGALRASGVARERIAVDEDGLAHGYLDALERELPGARLETASQTLRWVRKVKTPEELERLAGATRAAEQAIAAAAGAACEGIAERDVARELERALVAAGAQPRFTLVRFGRNGVAGQVEPGAARLRRGDTIWFDIGCVADGYWADVARVFALGEPSRRALRVHAAMVEGERRALAETTPGMKARDVFGLTVDAVRSAGVPAYRRHHVGHGIGVEAYDAPMLTADNDEVVEEGTVLNVETPYYEFGLGALHVEDPFVVAAEGNRLLSTTPADLQVIG